MIYAADLAAMEARVTEAGGRIVNGLLVSGWPPVPFRRPQRKPTGHLVGIMGLRGTGRVSAIGAKPMAPSQPAPPPQQLADWAAELRLLEAERHQ